MLSGYGVLEQIYPGQIGDLYDDLRIMERLADIFLECIGVRGSLRMGSTGFRNFTRLIRSLIFAVWFLFMLIIRSVKVKNYTQLS